MTRIMHSIRTRPAVEGALGWYDISPSRRVAPARRFTGQQQFDVAIVGAGFTGVALARRLAELRPGARIALIDALETGQGASGRNAGFLIDVPHNVDSGTQDVRHDLQRYALNCSAIACLRELKDRFQIDCDWTDAGKYMVAHEDRNLGRLGHFAAALQAAGFDYETMEGAALARRLGTDYYKAAVYTPGNVLVNPASLVRGLAASLPSSVTLFESSPVVACEYGSPHKLVLPSGSLRAGELVLTVGSFAEAFGPVANRVASLFTYASLTGSLSEREATAHFPGLSSWGATSAHPAGTTLRYTPDRRIFIRNTFYVPRNLRHNDGRLRDAWVQHRKSFTARFPGLAATDFAYTWAGLISMTLNNQSLFREEAGKLFRIVGCNGVGVVKGTYLGRYMAEFMNGMRSPELDFILATSSPSWMPPDPVRRIGAAWRLRREQADAGREV